MSKETGAKKSSEIEGATDIETNGVNSSEDSKSTTQQDADSNQQDKSATRENEEAPIAPDNASSNNLIPGDGTRPIIAVSANKNPTAFFQLARKFLMTNEMVDFSALEGAIVTAVDAAHLLERSQLASIFRIHTSYVNVEPKRRRQASQQRGEVSSSITTEGARSSTSLPEDDVNAEDQSETIPTLASPSTATESKNNPNTSESQQGDQQPTTPSTSKTSAHSSGGGSRELRRARLLMIVKRTECYKRWLEENPSQRHAISVGTATVTPEDVVGGNSTPNTEINTSTDLHTKSSPPSCSD